VVFRDDKSFAHLQCRKLAKKFSFVNSSAIENIQINLLSSFYLRR
jgi:hypothetical protein